MRSILLVFLGACSYGILSTFVKLSYDAGFTVDEVTGSQMVFGAVMIWMIALFSPRGKATRKQWLMLLLVGTSIGTTGVFYYASLLYVPASIGIVLLFQFTWMGVIIESVVNRKRPDLKSIIALPLLIIGTLLAGGILEGNSHGWHWLGITFGLLAALSYAVFIICSGKVATRVNAISRSAVMLTGALIITLVIFPPAFLYNGSLGNGLFLWGILLALFGPIIPTVLFAVGIPKIGGELASIVSAAELPMAVFMSSVVLRESVTFPQWVGVVIILIGISIPEFILWFRQKKAKIQLPSP